jgi:hypothetical protein
MMMMQQTRQENLTPVAERTFTNLAKSRWRRTPLTTRARISAAPRPAPPGHRHFRTV